MDLIRHYFYWLWKPGYQAEAEEENESNVDPLDKLTVDPLSASPYKAWNSCKSRCRVEKLKPMPANTPISESSIRFVCVGDTHVRLEKSGGNIHDIIPPGDVLLHAGDFTMHGAEEEINMFNHTYGTLPHKVKILIAGNHDLTLDKLTKSPDVAKYHQSLLTNFIYLEDAMLEFCGIKLYGSPWVPLCGNWGFTIDRGAPLLRRWNMIPNDVDILMTHGPPLGYGDSLYYGLPAGCVDLLNTIRRRVRPKYHVCGHIHEGYGMRTDGQTVFINAALCTKRYRPLNPPIVFDYPLPPGHTKQELDDVINSLQHFEVDVKDDVQQESWKVHKAKDFMQYSEHAGKKHEEDSNDDSDGYVSADVAAADHAADHIVFSDSVR